MNLLEKLRTRSLTGLRKRSVVGLARVACCMALVALCIMCASILFPGALFVIFAMSVGHLIGVLAFVCYLLSILLDVVRGADHAPDEPGPARKFSASGREPGTATSGDST